MKKYQLMAPGPTPVPSEVLLAMAKPIIHHRTPEYDALFVEVRAGLKRLFQTAPRSFRSPVRAQVRWKPPSSTRCPRAIASSWSAPGSSGTAGSISPRRTASMWSI